MHSYSRIKTEGIHKGITHPPFLRKANTTQCQILFLKLTNFSKTRKNGQSKYLPRSHLVYLKVIKARNSLMLFLQAQPILLVYRKPPLPQESQLCFPVWNLVAVLTSSLESCRGGSSMIIATSQKILKRFQKHPSCTGSLKLQPCVQASVLPSKTLSNLETFLILFFQPPLSFQGAHSWEERGNKKFSRSLIETQPRTRF